MYGSFSLPFFPTFEFIAFILLIYFSLRVFAKLAGYIKSFSRLNNIIKRILPLLDLITIVIIIFWLVVKIFWGSDTLPLITASTAVIFIGLLGWFWGRDFVAGIILKSENYFEKNKMIKLNDKNGRIIKTTLRYLEYETDSGESIRVPYSKISRDYFSKLSPDEKYESHLITIPMNMIPDSISLRESIRKKIYNSPWYLAGKEPVIEIDSSEEGRFKVKVNIYTINSLHADLIRRELIEGIEK
jgi:hypothetical protein